MRLSDKEMLRQLGSGESIEAVCNAARITRQEFDQWWTRTTRSCLPGTRGNRQAAVEANVRIERDRLGIPHIYAENDEDLFFGFGYAMAQDRLFQLEVWRRRATGRCATPSPCAPTRRCCSRPSTLSPTAPS